VSSAAHPIFYFENVKKQETARHLEHDSVRRAFLQKQDSLDSLKRFGTESHFFFGENIRFFLEVHSFLCLVSVEGSNAVFFFHFEVDTKAGSVRLSKLFGDQKKMND